MDGGQLQLFSKSLGPPEIYLEKVRKVKERLFKMIREKSRYPIDRCRIVGGMEKRTSTFMKADADIVIYFNNDGGVEKAEVVDDIQEIILLHTEITEGQMHKTGNGTLKFRMDKVPVDLLLAVNYVPYKTDKDFVNEQRQQTIMRIKQSGDCKRAAINMGPELSESSVLFMKKKSEFVHDLVRNCKYWYQSIVFQKYSYGGSLIIETLATKAALVEQNNNACPSFLNAFKGFLNLVWYIKDLEIVFLNFYTRSEIPRDIEAQRPLLMDPTNPFNNLLDSKNIDRDFLDGFAKCASNTLMFIESGWGFDKVLYPQCLPNAVKGVYGSYIMEVRRVDGNSTDCEPMPNIIVRNSRAKENEMLGVSTMLALAGAVTSKVWRHDNWSENFIEDTVSEFIIEKKDNRGKIGKWNPSSENHEDRDLTFVVPISPKYQTDPTIKIKLSFNVNYG